MRGIGGRKRKGENNIFSKSKKRKKERKNVAILSKQIIREKTFQHIFLKLSTKQSKAKEIQQIFDPSA